MNLIPLRRLLFAGVNVDNEKDKHMEVIIRKLTDGDNLGTVAQLIYETDNFVFPHFFKDSMTNAKAILSNMIELDTIYNKNNIYVAICDEKIVGIAIIVSSPIQINISAYIEAFERADALIDATFEKVMKEYYFPFEYEPFGYIITNTCVDKAYRGRGICSQLIDHITGGITDQDVYLECLADNEVAITAYKANGFEPLVRFTNFTGLDYYKMVKRFDREENK